MAKPTQQPDPWKEAEEYGCDMSLLMDHIRMTPRERIAAHRSALALAEKLRQAKEAMGRPHDRETVLQLRAIRSRRRQE